MTNVFTDAETTQNAGGLPRLGELRPPYLIKVEVNCAECGGSGFDPGGVDPWGPEPCPACHGAKTRVITRNFLTEAFQIAANPESLRPVERAHLVAIIQHCRELVSALVVLPDVAEESCGAARLCETDNSLEKEKR